MKRNDVCETEVEHDGVQCVWVVVVYNLKRMRGKSRRYGIKGGAIYRERPWKGVELLTVHCLFTIRTSYPPVTPLAAVVVDQVQQITHIYTHNRLLTFSRARLTTQRIFAANPIKRVNFSNNLYSSGSGIFHFSAIDSN